MQKFACFHAFDICIFQKTNDIIQHIYPALTGMLLLSVSISQTGDDDIVHRQYSPQPYRPLKTTYRPYAISMSATLILAILHCVSKKRPTCTSCYNFLHTQLDCVNLWHKCCRESRQSKCTLFSHLT